MRDDILIHKCKQYRKDIINIISKNNIGHLGGTLSLVEIMTYLYWKCIYRKKAKLILSKGHAALLQYIILKDLGIINEDITEYGMIDSKYETHPVITIPGIDFPSGSLGQGISGAVGIAISYRYQNIIDNVFCVLGDGELNEGEVWEALSSIIQYDLLNLIIIIDINDFQLDGSTRGIYTIDCLKRIFGAMGFEVTICNGNDISELDNWYRKRVLRHPAILLAKTIKGRGITFMEGNNDYHGSFLCENNDMDRAIDEISI